MAKKTNKTSHVLNLLTNGGPEGEEAKGPAAKEGGVSAAEGHGAAPDNKVIVVNETSENEKLSNTIKDRLEAQLEEEVAQTATAGKASFEAEEDDGESRAKEPAASASVEEGRDEKEKDTPAGGSLQPAVPEKKEEGQRKRAYNMMNVMERLLASMEDDMESEMRQNGVCMCDRCRADVQALVLTQMPAKYVIVDSSNASPIIGYYENRYKISMLTEILKACIKVKEQPRH